MVHHPLGSRLTAAAGCLALTGGLAGLALGSAVDSLLVVVAVGFVLQGIGYGLLRPAMSTALADAVDVADLGIAGATERLSGQVGVVFGITIMASLYASETGRFPLAFAVGAGFAVAATLSALSMGRRPVEETPVALPEAEDWSVPAAGTDVLASRKPGVR